ncbi:MAG: DUF1824 family protein [Cyanobacteriota bacterium]|jgi:hypothetical protein|nr:DUF1824 family protein [Cyanobacteriota bacterium]
MNPPDSPSSEGAIGSLADLRGLRSAPSLSATERGILLAELRQRAAACQWFTVGVMAPSAAVATAALRHCEHALGWRPLDPASGAGALAVQGPVFLKGNQATGTYSLRPEAGLGEGILITGHHPSDAAVEDTWGPLPLDAFNA